MVPDQAVYKLQDIASASLLFVHAKPVYLQFFSNFLMYPLLVLKNFNTVTPSISKKRGF